MASVPPDMQYGTVCAPGSNLSTAARSLAYVGESTGAVSAVSRW